jgi:hypothetical protein
MWHLEGEIGENVKIKMSVEKLRKVAGLNLAGTETPIKVFGHSRDDSSSDPGQRVEGTTLPAKYPRWETSHPSSHPPQATSSHLYILLRLPGLDTLLRPSLSAALTLASSQHGKPSTPLDPAHSSTNAQDSSLKIVFGWVGPCLTYPWRQRSRSRVEVGAGSNTMKG